MASQTLWRTSSSAPTKLKLFMRPKGEDRYERDQSRRTPKEVRKIPRKDDPGLINNEKGQIEKPPCLMNLLCPSSQPINNFCHNIQSESRTIRLVGTAHLVLLYDMSLEVNIGSHLNPFLFVCLFLLVFVCFCLFLFAFVSVNLSFFLSFFLYVFVSLSLSLSLSLPLSLSLSLSLFSSLLFSSLFSLLSSLFSSPTEHCKLAKLM